ncbi:TPA: filamentous hemagglutinin N-terminal domain-containing protein [Campylobacter jejuni]|nr:filamentous hemagglutinin N-terminal domain-containing protein [Campylobacter jejuni]HEF5264548.1 filamentous hemagglutinin N-terminal domain-containing protein [Campylobacter jejuni]HEF5340040.1 filamentous hemagglutinin N-terminal domain-containing protein [Campylobacter jejuni]HEG6715434.1 filamentous hemagglutinin N-terminal domain-containing protein [Campylobacter jejuni]
MKKLNKLSLSLVVGSLLFTQSYALPSGGKFTHGTSGSISVSGGTMNISGSKTNSVIQWGGGFNIANGETVNFKGNGYNYLNIVYGSKSSHIDGTLEGGTNNIFLINPNGIVVGKDGSINANRVFLSASSIGDKEMKEFAKDGKISAFEGNPLTTASPVIKSNAGNVINLGTITAGERVVMVGNQVSNMKYGSTDYGKFIFTNKKEQSNTVYLDVYSNDIFVIRGPASNTIKKEDSVMLSIRPNKGSTGPGGDPTDTIGYKETSDLVAKDNISNEVLNSIFSDLKFNSSVNINDLSKIYGENGELLSENILQSMDFITALYGQASTSDTLKNALANSQDFLNNAGKIADIQAKLKNISDLKTQQASNKAEYDKAVEEYKKAVEAYNTALKGLTGNNADTTLAGLKQAVDNAYKKVQDSINKNEDYYTQLEGLKTEVSDISIDGEHKLTASGSFDRNYAILPSVNSGSNNSNNGNDGTDSGDINNGNNNGSNNNPNDTIGQQEPDIATALLMQTTDEDPNINEDDKQASIDEASTQESGNACIVSDNFKAGNPCSR